MQRAERVAATKNLDPPGTSPPPPEFTVLAALPDDHLLLVAEDSCICFNPANNPSIEPTEFLSVIRANELAQAKIDAARAAVSAMPGPPAPAQVEPQPPNEELGCCGQASPPRVAPSHLSEELAGCGHASPPRAGPCRHRNVGLKPCRSSLRIKNLTFK